MCEAGRATRSDTPHDVPARSCGRSKPETKLARFGNADKPLSRSGAIVSSTGSSLVISDFLELFRRGIKHQVGRMCAAVAGFG